MLTGISSFCPGLNQPGLQLIEYLPVIWIDLDNWVPLVSSQNNWQLDVPLLQGQWLQAHILADTNGNWREDPRPGPGGNSYRQRVRGVTPKLRPEATGEIERTERHPLLLRLTDRNDRKWIMGTPDQPFRLEARARTNPIGSYELSFEAEVSKRATGYIPLV